MLLESFKSTLLQPRKALLKRSFNDVAARVLLVTIGNYFITALFTAALSLSLPLFRPDAVLAATMLGFPLFSAIAIVTFKFAQLRCAIAFMLSAFLVGWGLLRLAGGNL